MLRGNDINEDFDAWNILGMAYLWGMPQKVSMFVLIK